MMLSFLGRVLLADRAIKEEGYLIEKFPKKYPDAKLLEVVCNTSKEFATIWTDFDLYKAIYLLENDSLIIESLNSGREWGKIIENGYPWDEDTIMEFPDEKLIDLEEAIRFIRKKNIKESFRNVVLRWPLHPKGKRVYLFTLYNPVGYRNVVVDAYTGEITIEKN